MFALYSFLLLFLFFSTEVSFDKGHYGQDRMEKKNIVNELLWLW